MSNFDNLKTRKMILFPPCKINLGLDILRRRDDGYHDIDTVMLPIRGLCDSLEIVSACDGEQQSEFSFSGITVDCPCDQNIVVRAWNLMHERYGAGLVKAHLHKVIPFGAGLGGGSADAAFMLRGLNELFSLGLSRAELAAAAAELGSDVPFFIYDDALRCTGRGETMAPADITLAGCWMVIVKPEAAVSTSEAYSGITPFIPDVPLPDRLAQPVEKWKDDVINAFEATGFERYPELGKIKAALYEAGAIYASMSGSGSALYGIFPSRPQFESPDGSVCWTLPL